MKFRTEIAIKQWKNRIDHSHNILSLGSCFADNISRLLAYYKFRVTASPTGILFNPLSIAQSIEAMQSNKRINAEELIESDGRYLHHDFHSSLSGATVEEALERMNSALALGAEALHNADYLIVTLGTAWAYRLRSSGKVVANCHKQPSSNFERELLDIETIVEALERIAARCSARIILTVSPVRHIGEGMEDNSLSKALLRVAVSEVCARRGERVGYFPSYEIMMDDLRDYRFYASDMAHPTEQAVDYIADKFFSVALCDEAKSLMQWVHKVVSASEHRPFDPASEAYKTFCRKQLDDIAALSQVDFSEEKAHFERMLQINL
jgi:hypothetical protein